MIKRKIPMKLLAAATALLFTFVSSPSSAERFESGETKVQLVELYTSEGCSSCPPADRWLSGLKESKQLWSEFVPMAFHVDYWDYIGWADPFAEHEYSQRQRRYAAEQNEAVVYTPGLRSNGHEWRGWRDLKQPIKLPAQNVGNLVFSISDEGEFSSSFDNQLDERVPQLNVAILGLDLSTQVTRGENRGRELKHDFVVLGLSRFASNAAGQWSGKLPKPKVESDNYALAVWVSRGSDLSPIQSTGGYLANNIQL